MPTGEVKYTTTAPTQSRGKADVATWRSAVAVPSGAISGLAPAARSVLAGLAELPLADVDALAEAGLPIVIETTDSASRARERAQVLGDEGLPAAAMTGPGLGAPAATLTLGVLSAAALLMAALAGLTPALTGLAMAGLVGALVFLVLGAGLGAGALWAGSRSLSSWRELASTRRAFEEASARRARARRGRASQVWARIAELRRQLGTQDLPLAVDADIRSGLKDLEAHLSGVATMLDSAQDALGRVDLDQLRTRLTSLSQRASADPSLARQRDRLSRTLGDLEALEQQRLRLDHDMEHIEDALDEISATLGHYRAGDEVDPGAVDRLVRSTRLAREAMDSLDGAEARTRAALTEVQ